GVFSRLGVFPLLRPTARIPGWDGRARGGQAARLLSLLEVRQAPGAGSEMTPGLSLVIAVYRQPQFLEWIFASLENQTFRDFEVVIADDGSGPEIADVVRRTQARFRQPVRHVWHEDQGFRKTIIVNQAVTMTSAPYLVFIDGDCILHHRFLERHFTRRR